MNITTLLYDRTACLNYIVTPFDDTFKSWVGGNAPAFFDDKVRVINAFGVDHFFYTTLLNPFDETQQMSIFIPKNFEVYLKHCHYPTCSIKVFVHPVSEMSSSDAFKNPFVELYGIVRCDDFENKTKYPMQHPLIKFGGHPDHLNDEKVDCVDDLMADGYSFIFQVDERGYPNYDPKNNTNTLGFAALYIYAQILDKLENPLAGYWQFV